MKKGKKVNLVVMSLLGTGILLGSSYTKALAYDQELIISGGATESQDQIGAPSEDNNVQIDQSSIWTGNLTVSDSGTSQVDMSQTSLWTGDLKVDSGDGTVIMDNSTWRGDVSVSGNSNWGSATINLTNSSVWDGDVSVNPGSTGIFHLTDSTWNGDIVATGTDTDTSHVSIFMTDSQRTGDVFATKGNVYTMLSGSSLVGDFHIQDNSLYMDVGANSSWAGNYTGTGTDQAISGIVNIRDNSVWKGNADISLFDSPNMGGTTFGVTINDRSLWQGDVSLTATPAAQVNGFHTYAAIFDRSSWIGNANVNGSFSASLANQGNWIGSAVVTSDDNASPPGTNISIHDNSYWEGNLSTTYNNPDPSMGSYTSISVADHSRWVGNTTVAGNIETSVSVNDNSIWLGDIDVSQVYLNPVSIYNPYTVGSVSLHDESFWRGKAIGGDGSVDVLLSRSTWEITDSSTVANLDIDKSTIAFTPHSNGGQFSTLTVMGDFSNNENLFIMNTDIAGNVGDLLDIQGEIFSDESSKIQINNQGSAWVNTDNELTIVKTATGGDADLFLLANQIEVGGFEYGLKQVGTNWNLYSTGRLTSTAQGSMNLISGSYLLNYAENQTLLQRMGELRDSEHKQGVWGRIYGGEVTSSKNGMLDGYEMKYTGVQIGRDKKFDLGKNRGTIYFGGMFGYGKGFLDYGNGNGNIDSKTLGFYGTYINPNGFYADTVLKYNKMKNDFKVIDTAGVGIKGEDINTDGLHLSLELGQRVHFDRKAKEGWYIEPQAQISFGRVTGGDFTASNGLRIHVDDYNTVIGRVGTLIGYEIKGGKNPVNIYGKISYVHEFDGDIGYRFNRASVRDSFGDSWVVFGVGVTAQLSKNDHLYLDIERASGGQFNQPWAINGGYRFTW